MEFNRRLKKKTDEEGEQTHSSVLFSLNSSLLLWMELEICSVPSLSMQSDPALCPQRATHPLFIVQVTRGSWEASGTEKIRRVHLISSRVY